ncbi:MAG TPA: hypothetical protein VHZ09_13320 [Acidobacteriaceae bacterium]|jgi:hypothetical protein|nr:hypothetical protein [Acidobacteriaceae bacterium]
MSEDLLAELGRQILKDLARSSLAGALPAQDQVQGKRGRLPKSPVAPSGEDMDARLRGIRRYISAKELAALLHWHVETLYKKVKQGLPVDRDIGPDGRGRTLKFYSPQVADWLRECREVRVRAVRAKQFSQLRNCDHAAHALEKEMETKK